MSTTSLLFQRDSKAYCEIFEGDILYIQNRFNKFLLLAFNWFYINFLIMSTLKKPTLDCELNFTLFLFYLPQLMLNNVGLTIHIMNM